MIDKSLAVNEKLVGWLVRRYMPPLILAVMGANVASFVNTILAGRFLGAGGLAVLSLVATLDYLYAGIGLLVAIGGAVICGAAIGRGDMAYCNSIFTIACGLSVTTGIVFSIFGMANAGAIAVFLGAEGDNLAPCADYLKFFFAGSAPALLLYIPLYCLPVIGRPGRVMTVQIMYGAVSVGAFCLLSLGFSMGMAALGLARTLGSLCALVTGSVFLLGDASQLAFCRVHGLVAKIKEILNAGSPSAVEYGVAATRILLINQILVRGGMGSLLPCWSLVNSVRGFIAVAVDGIIGTAESLICIAFGEKDYRNIRVTVKKVFYHGAAIIIPLSIALILFRFQVVALFGQRDPYLASISAVGLCFTAGSFILNMSNNLLTSVYTATRRAWIVNTMNPCRFLVFSVIPVWLLLPYYGINAVFSMYILAEIGAYIVLAVCLLMARIKNPNLSPLLLLDRQEEERIQAIDFSVLNDTGEITGAAAKIGEFCKEHNIPAKERFHVSLAIEEMLLMIKVHAHVGALRATPLRATQYIDVRIVIDDGVLIMRIRDIGKHFNPLDYYHDNKDSRAGVMETLGIGMVLKMAKDIEYRETYGVNNLIITI
jgi:Na+-driven multidrug efflux pump/anti-sigma regulatory factor (Ser/Thr protein kinase)